jgi:hypothetical protein
VSPNPFITSFSSNSDFLLVQTLVEQSRAKDQFLRVAVKRMTETQLFEDELKDMSQLNTILLARSQELEAQLTEESQAKNGKHSTDSGFHD